MSAETNGSSRRATTKDGVISLQKSNSVIFEIDTSTFEYHSSESLKVVGSIWISCGTKAFPGRRWSDFPVVLMGWWVNHFLDVFSGKQKVCELLFMDGPYSVILDPSDLSVSFVKRFAGDEESIEIMHIDSFEAAFASCVAQARELVRLGSIHGWRDRDFVYLRDTIDSLPHPRRLTLNRPKFQRDSDN